MNQRYLEASRNLYYSSFLTILSVLVSYYFSLHVLSYSTTSVLLSSINYWRYPIKGLRRNIDITLVIISLLTHLYYSFSYYYINYVYIVLLSFLFYFISNRLINIGFYWIGMQFHLLIHLTSNINNLLLYSHIINYEYNQNNYYLPN